MFKCVLLLLYYYRDVFTIKSAARRSVSGVRPISIMYTVRTQPE